MDVLKIENLKKQFGSNIVIDGLTLTVPEHSVYGFLGQNGAGKTTTMKMILGLLKPDKGTIAVCGEQVRYGASGTNRLIGYLPDVPEFYSYMRPAEYLNLCGEIAGLSKQERQQKGVELLDQVGLSGVKKKIGGFSRGMKQRLGIAQALLGEPRLLICDEPTSALDPVGRREILDILQQISGKTTVLFSTHILSDVEKICDHAAVLHSGKLAVDGELSQLREKSRQDTIHIEFADVHELSRFQKHTVFKSECRDNHSIYVHSEDIQKTYQKVLKELMRLQMMPLKTEVLEADLESLFLEVIR